jgi:hypothetical protein
MAVIVGHDLAAAQSIEKIAVKDLTGLLGRVSPP